MTTDTIVAVSVAAALVAAIAAVAAVNYEANVAVLALQRTPAAACARDWSSAGYNIHGVAIPARQLTRPSTFSMQQYARC